MSAILGVMFLVIFAIVLVAISLGMRFLEGQRRKQLKVVLDEHLASMPKFETTVLRPEQESPSFIEQTLDQAGLLPTLRRMIQQAGLLWTPSQLVLAVAIAAGVGILIGLVVHPLPSVILNVSVPAFVLAMLPLFILRLKRRQRLREIEEQLPEALDFLARSMRAGHAFTISLEMVGEELPGALGHEFRTLFNEVNLGSPMEAAMANLAARVPLLDVRLLVSSVLLQRQTGGNLSEVLTRLATIIRERFRFRGQIRAASAHGRITALALTLMPLAMLFLLPLFAPGYLQTMLADPEGVWMLAGAGVAQIVGYLIMRSITNIKV
ncbi:MAG: hypothetical protein RL328_1584 [Acidobacteriota bacterium]|jgi:tight adherence protein B